MDSSGKGRPRICSQANPLKAMSWGFTRRSNREPGTVSAFPGKLGEQLDDLLCEHSVPDRSRVRLVGSMRFTPDPSGKSIGIEAVSSPVGIDTLRDGDTVLIGGHETLVCGRDQEIGMGDVPLAPVVGLVSARSKPISEGWGTPSVPSQFIAGSVFCLAAPSVCEAPWSDGY